VVLTSAPSSEEEKLGKLFVGAAGEMFEKMLANVLNLQRSEIFILPVVMCTSQRAPSSEELTACRSLVVAQLRLLKPRAALAMGPDALAFLGPDVHRGEWTMVEGVEVLPTWHPMELLAQSNNKRAALGHLQDVQRKLAQTSLFGM
jgi:DNA polymerase